MIGEAAAVRGALDAATAGVEEAYARSQQAEANRLTGMISGLLESLDTARRSISDAKDAVEKEHQEAAAWGARRGGGSTVPSPQPTPRWPGYPPLAAVPLSWSDRMHILYGDELRPRSGGRLHGVNRPGKTEFPQDWDEDMIAREVTNVARNPDSAAERLDGMWRVAGVRRGVTMVVILRPDGTIKTGYPEAGPGIKKNPK